MTDAPHSEEWVLADAFDRAAPDLRRHGRPLPRLPRPAAHRGRGARRPAPGTRGRRRALRVLDLGCGSGASTRAVLDAWSARGGSSDDLSVTGVDASEGMVAQARAKRVARRASTLVVVGRRRPPRVAARAVRSTASSRPTCCATCPTATRLVAEVARVLRPGGAFVVHDYSVAGNTRGRGDLGRRSATASSSRSAVREAVRRAAAPLPLHERARLRLGRPASASGCCRVGLVDVRHRSFRGWQHGLVHTVAGSAPS